MNLHEAKRIHCIGIGGIGISAIAKLLVAQGKSVSGSDAADSEIVGEAAQAGVRTIIGHAASNVGDAEVVIYSEAVPPDNPERQRAREEGILEISGAEALAGLTEGKRLIAIAGTNGKSTTTALIGLLLHAGGLDPTVIVGSKVKNFPLGNVRVGKSDWFVLEADEYQAKFLNLKPEIAVVTNIEEDHLDYYRDLDHIRETFQKFLDRVREGGKIFLNTDRADVPLKIRGLERRESQLLDFRHHEGGFSDVERENFERDRKTQEGPPSAARRERGGYVKYGFNPTADYLVSHLEVINGNQRFTLTRHGKHVGDFSLRVPGKFNVYNALAALSVALELGVSADVCQAVLGSFTGIWRRFEIVGEREGALIVSDYGHHPTAIRETLRGAREFYPDRRLVLIFQPHHHHRTKALFNDFVHSFTGTDILILPEIYAVRGREEGDTVSSQDLVAALRDQGKPKEAYYGGTLEETECLVRNLMKAGDLLLFMGAGNIDTTARRMLQSS